MNGAMAHVHIVIDTRARNFRLTWASNTAPPGAVPPPYYPPDYPPDSGDGGDGGTGRNKRKRSHYSERTDPADEGLEESRLFGGESGDSGGEHHDGKGGTELVIFPRGKGGKGRGDSGAEHHDGKGTGHARDLSAEDHHDGDIGAGPPGADISPSSNAAPCLPLAPNQVLLARRPTMFANYFK